MFKIIVCIKQVPMVSELPWDSKTGTLKRDLAQGMMDPASRRALEAALRIKEERAGKDQDTHITVISMGPPMAQEILYEAKALGADTGVLLSDRKMAGADTFLTSFILAEYIRKECPGFDLLLCGTQTSDSETAQVGPQLAGELMIPAMGYVRSIELEDGMVRVRRHVDDFMEVLEMDLPGLLTIDLGAYTPRYVPLEGIERAFQTDDIRIVNAGDLELAGEFNALKDSPTRIIDVYSPATRKENLVLKGAVKKVVGRLFDDYGKIISGAMGKDLKTHEHEGAK
ncbi:MAG: electron transfer flavoprotein subunit beta/FixA family protein [Desulfobacteraceae bacterium]|nr:electron transfer flavoprotein subunit beta/FixA family protein [Desulfobacteraceae bacterium]